MPSLSPILSPSTGVSSWIPVPSLVTPSVQVNSAIVVSSFGGGSSARGAITHPAKHSTSHLMPPCTRAARGTGSLLAAARRADRVGYVADLRPRAGLGVRVVARQAL